MSDTFLTTAEINDMPKSVMIFGCGYVGTALAQKLIKACVRVGALTRNASQAADLKKLGVSEVVVEDLHATAWHPVLKDDYDAVVNCVSSAGGGLEGYRKSYVEGQRRILEWVEGSAIRSYVYTGSTSVYPQDGGIEVDETADTTAAPPTGQLLLESEQILMDAPHRIESRYVLRLAGIYGPGRHYLLDRMRSGERVIPGVGDYFLNLIHRDDITSAIYTLLTCAASGNSGIYNLADNHPTTKAKMVEWLAGQMGLPTPQFDPDQVSSRLQGRGGRMPSRRISNRKFSQTFAWQPIHPDFRSGYEALI